MLAKGVLGSHWLLLFKMHAKLCNGFHKYLIELIFSPSSKVHVKIDDDSFDSFWPSDTIRRQRSGSTLAQVMVCCLTAPSHYLNQCWLIISEVQWHSYQCNFRRDAPTINHLNPFENYIFKISLKFPRGQWVEIPTPMSAGSHLVPRIHSFVYELLLFFFFSNSIFSMAHPKTHIIEAD